MEIYIYIYFPISLSQPTLLPPPPDDKTNRFLSCTVPQVCDECCVRRLHLLFIHLLGFIFAVHSRMACNQPRKPSQCVLALVFSHHHNAERRACAHTHTHKKDKVHRQRKDSPHNLMKNRAEPLDLRATDPVQDWSGEETTAQHTHGFGPLCITVSRHPSWLRKKGTKPR